MGWVLSFSDIDHTDDDDDDEGQGLSSQVPKQAEDEIGHLLGLFFFFLLGGLKSISLLSETHHSSLAPVTQALSPL